jgi:hypothetical protein
MLGLTDCLVALGCALVDAKILTRDQIAELMQRAIAQQRAQDGTSARGVDPVRAAAPDMLRQIFSAPIARDWQTFGDEAKH